MAPPTNGPRELTPAIARRKRRRNRRRWMAAGVAAAALALTGLLVWALWFGSLFAVQQVSVSTAKLVTRDEVLAVAKVPLNSPLIRVNTEAMAARVATIRAVDSASVQRAFPHTVEITVTERTAVYQRKIADGYQWVDSKGVIFHTVKVANPALETAQTSGVSNRLLADVGTVVEALPSRLSTQVSLVVATSPDTITLNLSGGRTMLWGSAEQSELKAQVAVALLSVEATNYDVSSPANPTSK